MHQELPHAEEVTHSALHPWADNPRVITQAHIDQVADSLSRFGWGAPILARRNGEIIAGHVRWLAAAHLGWTRVVVRYLELDEREAHLLALADNRLTEAGQWDALKVAEVLSQHSLIEAELVGWSPADLERMGSNLMGADIAPEEPDGCLPDVSMCPTCGQARK